jgi:STE24 endopeptidase
MASTLTFVFIGLLIATTLTRFWLGSRHIGYVLAHRGQVPAAFKDSLIISGANHWRRFAMDR